MMIQSKKKPVRMCAACRQGKEKDALVRVVKAPDGTVDVDKTGKANGRGAYLCRDVACIQLAQKKNVLSRAFKMNVGQEIYNKLEDEIKPVE